MVIFDGLLTVHSSCRDCGQLMTVINQRDTVHPNCAPKPTKAETLAAGWLSTVLADDREAERLTFEEIEDIDNRPPQLAKAAVTYAKWGWPVFPLGEQSKAPAIPKRKGGNGFKDATSDVDRITAWWTRHPQHNIGLATGIMFAVIDIDPRNGGIPSFINLLRDNKIRDAHAVAVTASGGLHLYRKTDGKTRSYPGLAQGIDYKALGGYIVAPPSTLGERWRSYSWMTVPSPEIKRAT